MVIIILTTYMARHGVLSYNDLVLSLRAEDIYLFAVYLCQCVWGIKENLNVSNNFKLTK